MKLATTLSYSNTFVSHNIISSTSVVNEPSRLLRTPPSPPPRKTATGKKKKKRQKLHCLRLEPKPIHDNTDWQAFVPLASAIYIQRDVCLYLNCAKNDKRGVTFLGNIQNNISSCERRFLLASWLTTFSNYLTQGNSRRHPWRVRSVWELSFYDLKPLFIMITTFDTLCD